VPLKACYFERFCHIKLPFFPFPEPLYAAMFILNNLQTLLYFRFNAMEMGSLPNSKKKKEKEGNA